MRTNGQERPSTNRLDSRHSSRLPTGNSVWWSPVACCFLITFWRRQKKMTSSSNKELVERLRDGIWADLDIENSFPAVRPLLAHYTSLATLERIMASNEIWFSNPLYMNDWEELRFGMLEGGRAFRESASLRDAFSHQGAYLHLIQCFDQLFNEFDAKHAFQTYLMCLSVHQADDNDGRLSMWRGYGASGSGCAVVFDTSKIEARADSPLIIGPIKYGSSAERLAWINAKINALAKALKGQSLDEVALYHVAFHWLERLKLFALFTKHDGFREEHEWRIVYMPERDPNGLLADMHSYAITARGAEPKLKLKLAPLAGVFNQDLSFDKIVDRVILGPTTATTLAVHTVKRILGQNGKAILAQKIVASSIPFRP